MEKLPVGNERGPLNEILGVNSFVSKNPLITIVGNVFLLVLEACIMRGAWEKTPHGAHSPCAHLKRLQQLSWQGPRRAC